MATHGLVPTVQRRRCAKGSPPPPSAAPERIRAELEKLLAAGRVRPALLWAARTGVLPGRWGGSSRRLPHVESCRRSRRRLSTPVVCRAARRGTDPPSPRAPRPRAAPLSGCRRGLSSRRAGFRGPRRGRSLPCSISSIAHEPPRKTPRCGGGCATRAAGPRARCGSPRCSTIRARPCAPASPEESAPPGARPGDGPRHPGLARDPAGPGVGGRSPRDRKSRASGELSRSRAGNPEMDHEPRSRL